MIYSEGRLFVCSAEEPYAEDVKRAGWRFRGTTYSTDDPLRVIDFVDYLSDELKERMVLGAQNHAASTAAEASPGFEVPTPEGLELYGFQKADVEYILNRDMTLLAEDAGLGKSAIMICAANIILPKRVLIICPAVAKYNWSRKEWPKWSTQNLSVGVVEVNDWVNTDVVIINYDILDRHKKRIQAVAWDYVIVDESHRIKNSDAKRTSLVLGGNITIKNHADALSMGAERVGKGGTRYKVERIRAKKWVFATATPMNRPKDLWTMAKTCDPDGLGSDWMFYHRRYCAAKRTKFGWDTKGSDYLEELGAKMRATFMLRHDPDEVLDLPPLREEIFLLPPVEVILDNEEEFVQDNMAALLGLAHALGDNSVTAESSPQKFMKIIGEAVIDNVSLMGVPEFTPLFTKFALIRKKTGELKVPHVVDFVKEVSEGGELPIAVFGYHRTVMEALKESFPDSAYVVGGMKSSARDQEVDRFQRGEVNVFLGNVDAAGEAITLTRANRMVIAEMDWRGSQLIQVRKRIHRITQDKPCSVWYTCAADSFDGLVADKAFMKMKNIKETLDL